MAVTNVGISALTSDSADYINGYRIYAGDADRPLYLKWRTLSGAEVNDSFDISVDYRYVPRGVSEDGYWTDWNGGGWTNVPVSECNGRQTDGESGWQWSLDLATLLDRCGLKEAFADGATFGFGSRKFDLAHLQVNIKSQMRNGSASSRTDTQLWLGYFPEYEIERIYCDTLNEVKVDYSVPGWERVDDRWSLEDFDVNGDSLILDSKPWGTVIRHSASGNGTVVIPVEKLAKAAPIGENVYVKLNFNAAYRQSGAEFVNASYSGACENDAECNTPVVTVSTDGGVAYVTVEDSGDKGKPITSCIVKMAGSEFSFDQSEVPVGETAAFPCIPRSVPLTFEAVATAGNGTISSKASTVCAAIEPDAAVTAISIDGGFMAKASYDLSMNRSYDREKEEIKLAGRSRKCSYFGVGGSASWNLSFTIPPSCMVEDEAELLEAWIRVFDSGDCIVILGDGRRVAMSPDSISASDEFDDTPVSVSATLMEVDA